MRILLSVLFLVLTATSGWSQCEIPPSQYAQAPNMFTPQQENELGDIIAQQAQYHFRSIDDWELNGYLNRIVQRLLQGVPASPFTYRVQLIDEPFANAFSTVGARIYVTRKAALLARNEDELAGLLAHEVSHIYTRQMGADFTRMFQQVGITSVADRAELTRKYHQILDTWRTRHVSFDRKHSDQEQLVADQTALFMLALAGYRPESFGEYFDRFAETHGRTGGFWSDLFGTTPPEGKRLRDILATVAKLPSSCISLTRSPVGDFKAWQNRLLLWTPVAVTDQLHHVILRKRLNPPLLSDINQLLFSPDGQYILAQDDSTVTVLTRRPFAFLFRVELPPRPTAAMFSPDSSHLIVASSSGRVEKWSLVSMQRDSVRELPMQQACLQSKLSPDGDYFACLDADGSLRLLAIDTGNPVFEQKHFVDHPRFSMPLAAFLEQLGVLHFSIPMGFSPDGQYFAAASTYDFLAFNLNTKTPVAIRGNLPNRMRSGFVFIAGGKIITRDFAHLAEISEADFPSGNPIRTLKVGVGDFRPVSDGELILLQALDEKKHRVTGIFDMHEARFVGVLQPSAVFDMHGQDCVSERQNGWIELGEYANGKFAPAGHNLALSSPQLGAVRTAAVTDDLSWIAVSEDNRGGIFNLENGSRSMLVRGFKASWFDGKRELWADFPEFDNAPPSVATIDPAKGAVLAHHQRETDSHAHQEGPYLVVDKPEHPGRWSENWTLEVHSLSGDRLLWSRQVNGRGRVWSNAELGTVIFGWNADSSPAKEAAKSDAALATRLAQLRNRDQSYYLEVVDFASGKPLGHIVIDTGKGSYFLGVVLATGNFLVAGDTSDRVHVFSLHSGGEQTVMFANDFGLSASGMLSVQIEDHRIQVFDLNSGDKTDEFRFASPIAFSRFLSDGNRLLVMTRDQTVLVLKPDTRPTAVATLPAR